jgi:Spy/CpxP family protein refolding chaperone
MKTCMLVVVGLMVSSTLFAQEVKRESKSKETRQERMKRELSLSDEQVASIKKIDTKYAERKKEYDLKRLEEEKSMQAYRFERERDMRKLLTAEQNMKLDAYRHTHAKRGDFKRGEHKHGGKDNRFHKKRKAAGSDHKG